MSLELVKKAEQSQVRRADAAEQTFDDLVALKRSGSETPLLVAFDTEELRQRTRFQLLQWASEEGFLLYEEPIPGTFDSDFYLEDDTDD